MGGIGSGKVRLRRVRETVDRHRSIDIRQWKRQGLLNTRNAFVWSWFHLDQVAASIYVQASNDRVILTHNAWLGERPESRHTYPVYLTSTDCHLGGERRWFLCPTEGCMRRVAILYAGEIFACRRCRQLAYLSQREPPSARTIRRIERIRGRLEWERGFAKGNGDKPHYMHWRTFDMLTAEHDALVKKWLGDLDAKAKAKKEFSSAGSASTYARGL